MAAVYECLVSTACTSFRLDAPLIFPFGGAPTAGPGSTGLIRCDLIVEVFKVIYVLKARSSLEHDPTHAPTLQTIRKALATDTPPDAPLSVPVIDYSVHMLLLEILLVPPTLSAAHRGIFETQLHALQLLSAMPPHPMVFSYLLEVIYRRSLTAPVPPLPVSDMSSSTSLTALEDAQARQGAAADSNTVLALHLVSPLLTALLRILKVQLIGAEEIIVSGGNSERTAAMLIPILVSEGETW